MDHNDTLYTAPYSRAKILKTLFLFLSKMHFSQNYVIHQKQPSGGVSRKRCSENMQQIYKRTPIPQITLWHACSPVNLLHIFRIPFPKNTSEGLLL